MNYSDMEENLFRVRKNNKVGFINDKGQVIIDFMFDSATFFSHGLARIFLGGKMGFIDNKGNIVIQPKFDIASDFSEGMAAATTGNKYGYIDKTGNFVIEPKFYTCRHFKDGYARVMEEVSSKGCFIDKFGEIKLNGRNFLISKYSEGLINCPENGNWGYIDIDGNFVISPNYKFTKEFSEGKAAVIPKTINGKGNGKGLSAFINKNDEVIIPALYQVYECFSEGMCAVWDNGVGYINDEGRLVIPCNFDLGHKFSEGLALVKPKGKNQGYGYIDKTGAMIINPIFNHADDFKNGLAEVRIGKELDAF